MKKINNSFSEARGRKIINQKMKKTFLKSRKKNLSHKKSQKGGVCK
ncbi:MAG: hypothetical protein K9L84_05550 [Candidatus Omnitrophica bacterium]|nr:hypothetical protein [Candidatus Omnitrophota bacterium]MCF7894504.1 hypothetical protein [Candidatus Omnitrophota bacterium]